VEEQIKRGFRTGNFKKRPTHYINQCVESLRKHGILGWATRNTAFVAYLLDNGGRNPSQIFPATGIEGQGEVTGILPDGRRLEVACLKPRQGNPGARRMSFLNKINKSGGVAIWVNSAQHMIELLQELGYAKKEVAVEDVSTESGSGLCAPESSVDGDDPAEIRKRGA